MTIDPRRQPIREYEETAFVDVALEDTERVLVGLQLEEKLAELEVTELNWEERKKEHKDSVGGIWKEIRELRTQMRTSSRKEPMKVKRLMNYINGTVTIRRADTGQVMEERSMTKEEKQIDLL